MRKKANKKLTAAATVVAMAIGILNIGVQANVESVSAATQDEAEEIMPLYEMRAIVSWKDCEDKISCGSTYTVKSTPVKVVCYNCLTGAAKVSIFVNNKQVETMTIPKVAYQEKTVFISCKKGDKISFKVEPADGYAITTGDFMLYY